MVKSFLNWLKAWLLVTLFVFFGVQWRYRHIYAGMIFVTWSVPEFNDIESILFTVRALLAGSAFIGFCFTVSRD